AEDLLFFSVKSNDANSVFGPIWAGGFRDPSEKGDDDWFPFGYKCVEFLEAREVGDDHFCLSLESVGGFSPVKRPIFVKRGVVVDHFCSKFNRIDARRLEKVVEEKGDGCG